MLKKLILCKIEFHLGTETQFMAGHTDNNTAHVSQRLRSRSSWRLNTENRTVFSFSHCYSQFSWTFISSFNWFLNVHDVVIGTHQSFSTWHWKTEWSGWDKFQGGIPTTSPANGVSDVGTCASCYRGALTSSTRDTLCLAWPPLDRLVGRLPTPGREQRGTPWIPSTLVDPGTVHPPLLHRWWSRL